MIDRKMYTTDKLLSSLCYLYARYVLLQKFAREVCKLLSDIFYDSIPQEFVGFDMYTTQKCFTVIFETLQRKIQKNVKCVLQERSHSKILKVFNNYMYFKTSVAQTGLGP